MKIKRVMLILLTVVFTYNHVQKIITIPQSDLEKQVIKETQNLIPLSIQMIDHAIECLNDEPGRMSIEEQELFNNIFDPYITL